LTKTTTIEAQAKDLVNDLTEAETLLAARQTELAHTTTELASITRAWDAGDDTHTADDLVRAQAEHTRIESLTNAATTKVERLRDSQINLDLDVAHALSTLVRDVLKDRVPVEVRAGRTPQTVAAQNVPLAVLTQAKASTNQAGMLSGEVELAYLRDDMWTPFPIRELESLAERQRVGIEVRSQRIGNGTGNHGETLDWVKIGVGWIFAERPTIVEDPTDETVKEWARDLASSLAYTVRAVEEPVHYLGEAVDRSTGGVLAASIVSTSLTKDERTTKVVAELLISPRRSDYSPERLMSDALGGVAGSAARGLGRCTGAKTKVGLYSGLAYGRSTDRRVVSVTATFVSATE